MMAGYILKTICHCFLWFYVGYNCSTRMPLALTPAQMWRDNRKRDRLYGAADPVQAADNGMKGMTELENKHFR